MKLHFLNPDDEPRECPECDGEGEGCEHGERIGSFCSSCRTDVNPANIRILDCESCNGTGRLGREGANPEIEVGQFGGHFSWRSSKLEGMYWALEDYPDADAALKAARETLR